MYSKLANPHISNINFFLFMETFSFLWFLIIYMKIKEIEKDNKKTLQKKIKNSIN